MICLSQFTAMHMFVPWWSTGRCMTSEAIATEKNGDKCNRDGSKHDLTRLVVRLKQKDSQHNRTVLANRWSGPKWQFRLMIGLNVILSCFVRIKTKCEDLYQGWVKCLLHCTLNSYIGFSGSPLKYPFSSPPCFSSLASTTVTHCAPEVDCYLDPSWLTPAPAVTLNQATVAHNNHDVQSGKKKVDWNQSRATFE